MKASIDIGSNTILLLIARWSDGEWEVLEDRSTIVGLGKGIDKNAKFCEQSMDLAFDCFTSYQKTLGKYGLSLADVKCSATEASRIATNSSQFFSLLKSKFGLHVETISAKQEAYLAALGSSLSHWVKEQEEYVLLDIGGASSELTHVEMRPFSVLHSVSIPVGSVRATDWKSDGKNEKIRQSFHPFEKALQQYKNKMVIGIAGSLTTIAAMEMGLDVYSVEKVNQSRLSSSFVEKLYSELNGVSSDEILQKFPVVGQRAQTILGGLEVLREFIQHLNIDSISITNFGLRHGLISE